MLPGGYAGGMLQPTAQQLPVSFPEAGQLLLLVTPYVGGDAVFDLTAALAAQGSLRVVDGGNTFNAYRVVCALRRQQSDYSAAMQRIQLARAFTCYQLEAMLAELEGAPGPLLALDFLMTFGDQNVAAVERRRLLKRCLAHLRRLSRSGPVGVWVRARTVVPVEIIEFMGTVEQAAGRIWRLGKPSSEQAVQLSIF